MRKELSGANYMDALTPTESFYASKRVLSPELQYDIFCRSDRLFLPGPGDRLDKLISDAERVKSATKGQNAKQDMAYPGAEGFRSFLPLFLRATALPARDQQQALSVLSRKFVESVAYSSNAETQLFGMMAEATFAYSLLWRLEKEIPLRVHRTQPQDDVRYSIDFFTEYDHGSMVTILPVDVKAITGKGKVRVGDEKTGVVGIQIPLYRREMNGEVSFSYPPNKNLIFTIQEGIESVHHQLQKDQRNIGVQLRSQNPKAY